MKKIFIVPLLLFVVLGLLGCASAINKKMASWMGHDVNDLIASWGPPQQVMSDGKGGQILIFSQGRQWTTPGTATTNVYGTANTYGNYYGNTYTGNTYGNVQGTTTYTPPQTHGYQAQRMFWVNSSGKIYKWAWKGL
ncbi:MAG TPA: hypothetical protein ENH52_00420 [Nitrospirae bacterium]|nr:hypothetical protein [Nitrospirota bacterium]